jgi:hypothetical protein
MPMNHKREELINISRKKGGQTGRLRKISGATKAAGAVIF